MDGKNPSQFSFFLSPSLRDGYFCGRSHIRLRKTYCLFRILPIWEAWGEERRHVRFVVKRVRKKQNRSSDAQVVSEPNPRLVRSPAEDETPRTIAATCRSAGAPAPAAAPSRSSRLRRRNSVSSNASDTLHPRKLFQQQQRQRQDGGGRQGLEDMMEVRGGGNAFSLYERIQQSFLLFSGNHAPGSSYSSRADSHGPPPGLLLHPGSLRASGGNRIGGSKRIPFARRTSPLSGGEGNQS